MYSHSTVERASSQINTKLGNAKCFSTNKLLHSGYYYYYYLCSRTGSQATRWLCGDRLPFAGGTHREELDRDHIISNYMSSITAVRGNGWDGSRNRSRNIENKIISSTEKAKSLLSTYKKQCCKFVWNARKN